MIETTKTPRSPRNESNLCVLRAFGFNHSPNLKTMKTKSILTALLALTALTIHAGENHGAKIAGPNGGRVIETVEPHAEFLVLEDRRVQLTFLDDSLKPTPPAEQTAKIITGDRSAPTELSFTKSDTALISDAPLPEGATVPAVLQITPTPNAKTVTERITVNLAICPGCKLPEYACTCDH